MPTIEEEVDQSAVVADVVNEADEQRIEEAADRVQLSYKRVELHVTSIPKRRSADKAQKKAVAEMHKANVDWLSFMSRLWGPDEPAMKRFNQAHAAVNDVYTDRQYTLPSVHRGSRLVKRSRLEEFDAQLQLAAEDYANAVAGMAAEMPMLISRARESRGDLFNAADYYFDPRQRCTVRWSYPPMTEDPDLAELSSNIYQREVLLARENFKETIRLCEQEMSQRLVDSLTHMAQRLTRGDDGKPQVFKATTVNHVLDELDYIVEQFEDNRIGGRQLLDAAEKLKGVFSGQDREGLAETLRNHEPYREEVQAACEAVAASLASVAVAKPRRAILLPERHTTPAA